MNAGVTLPANLFDANGYRFDLQTNGTLSDGSSDAFDGGLYLSLYSSSAQSVSFSGPSFGTPEDNNREIAMARQSPAFGLNVTRKLFVPADGYFGRYLEVLTNPGATPITVDVAVDSNLGSDSATRVVATASGDTFFDTADTWLVTDDDALATPSGDPSLAFVLGGAGASRALSLARVSSDSIALRWNGVTVPPGQTVVLMHFVVQQPRKTGAIGAAQRLAQLPPEAMAGLSADERSQILNWAVPADGSSTQPAIPTVSARTAVVTGRTLAGDGLTPTRSGPVTFTSVNYPFFPESSRTVSADVDGVFTVANTFADAFTLQATDSVTFVQSPVVTGSFAPGDTTATRDVVFSNTGLVTGVVLRGGVPVPQARIYLDALTGYRFSAADGSYAMTGVLPGVHTVTAASLNASGAVTLEFVAGQAGHANIDIGAGTITGQVTTASGVPAGSSIVSLLNAAGGIEAQQFSDANGQFTFGGVALGRPVRIQARTQASAFTASTSAPITFAADGGVVTLDVRLKAVATARVHVVDTDGARPIPSALVFVDRHLGAGREWAGYTDVLGVLTVPNVPEPGFSVDAQDTFGMIGSANGTVNQSDEGATVDVTITATASAGRVYGSVFAADGATPVGDPNDDGGALIESVRRRDGPLPHRYPQQRQLFLRRAARRPRRIPRARVLAERRSRLRRGDGAVRVPRRRSAARPRAARGRDFRNRPIRRWHARVLPGRSGQVDQRSEVRVHRLREPQ